MSTATEQQSRAHLADLAHFLTASPSPFHAAATVAERLESAGFVRQDESAAWDASPGGHYLVRGGAVVAWRVPEDAGPDSGFRVVGAHTDSPALVLKPVPDTSAAGYRLANVEVYGGILRNSWLDRELGLAGRLVTVEGEQVLLATGPLLRIPQLAIHLDRQVNDGLVLDPQQHLRPLWSTDPDADLRGLLADLAGLEPDEVAGFDVRTFDTQPPGTFGAGQEFFAAGRLDNLLSVHAGLAGLLAASDDGPDVHVLACFDHEEIGSTTRSGADGPLLSDVLVRTGAALGADAEELRRMYARSSVLSSDGGHAVHPNYAERHDPDHRPVPNAGPMLKVNANQRYASDAEGAALWARACRAAGIASQVIVNNNTMPCGSTIGPLTAGQLGILTVDVGAPILSMHSAREMCGAADPYALGRALTAYWSGS